VARILVAGCGYVGSELARRLAADGHVVFGLRRSDHPLPEGVAALRADLCDRAGLRTALAEVEHGGIDAVVYAAAAAGADDEAYRRAYVAGLANVVEWADAQGMRPPRVLFTSSTAVYAQTDGSWVDEDSPTEPTHFSGVRMLEAERLVTGAGGIALRLGGIYGPGRTRLVDGVRAGRATLRTGPPRWTNRIHRDDCAGAAHHLLLHPDGAGAWVGVDHEPADERTVLDWLAARLGVPPPRRTAAPGPAPDRAATNKRCANRKLLASGYRFRYPTFREGYAALLAA